MGRGERSVTRLHTEGSKVRSIYTGWVGAFTADSSGNPPACEDRQQTQFSLGKHKEQITRLAGVLTIDWELLTNTSVVPDDNKNHTLFLSLQQISNRMLHFSCFGPISISHFYYFSL